MYVKLPVMVLNNYVYFALHHMFTLFLHVYPSGDWEDKNNNLYWIRLQMAYHKYNSLTELLNRDLAANIGQVIRSHELMEISFSFSNPLVFFLIKNLKRRLIPWNAALSQPRCNKTIQDKKRQHETRQHGTRQHETNKSFRSCTIQCIQV